MTRTARGAGWVMAWRLGIRFLGALSRLVRLIAPADFSIIALATTSFMQTIDAMLTLGTEASSARQPPAEASPSRSPSSA